MSNLSISEVRDFDLKAVLGVEIAVGDQNYFVALDQSLWKGLRSGQFPNASHGSPYPRLLLSRKELKDDDS